MSKWCVFEECSLISVLRIKQLLLQVFISFFSQTFPPSFLPPLFFFFFSLNGAIPTFHTLEGSQRKTNDVPLPPPKDLPHKKFGEMKLKQQQFHSISNKYSFVSGAEASRVTGDAVHLSDYKMKMISSLTGKYVLINCSWTLCSIIRLLHCPGRAASLF